MCAAGAIHAIRSIASYMQYAATELTLFLAETVTAALRR
jgi:hypothetical protein